MADAKYVLEFLKRGVGVLLDVNLEFLWVELTPMSPAFFRSQRICLHGIQIPINGASRKVEAPRGFNFRAAFADEFHDPFPQVQCISFHAHKPST